MLQIKTAKMPVATRLTSFGMIFCAAPVLAQSEESYDLGTIVLRGELQDRAIQDSPTSAVVETGEELDQRGDSNLYDIIARTPGVNSSFGERGFVIRGIDQRGVGGAGRGLLVTTQVDGVALPTQRSTFFGPFSTWDLQQVEILRGPQSTQQGRNALAGAVILRSNDPSFDEELRFRTELGSRNLFRFAAVANTPLIEDRLAFRFSADIFGSNGFLFNTLLNEDAAPESSETYRGKVFWVPNDRIEAVLSFARTNSSGGSDTFTGTDPAGPRTVSLLRRNIESSDQQNFGLRATWEVSDNWKLESETNYLVGDLFSLQGFDTNDPVVNFFETEERIDVFEQDLRFSYKGDGFDAVFGLFYTDINQDLIADFTIGTVTRVTDTKNDTENIAFYAEADIRADALLPGLSFTLGARYDYEAFSFRTSSFFIGAAFPPLNQSASTEFDAFLPKIGVTYEFSETQQLSFTVQRGYRAGGASVVTDPNDITQNFVNEFDAEFTTNYELAYRGSFAQDRVFVSANLFFKEWTDQQVVETIGRIGSANINQIVNAGKSELWGAELSIDAQPIDRLTLFGSFAYVDTEFVDFVTASSDFSGNSFANAPEVTLSIGASYLWDSGVTLAMDVSYQDNTFGDPGNRADQIADDFWLVNAQLLYETDQDWRIGLFARNLLDERYAVRRQFLSATQLTVGEPRTVGFYIERSF